MGVVYSRIVRQVNRLNVENRAFRAIERKKPLTAPKHPSTEKYLEESLKDSRVTVKSLQERDTKLDGYLKDVYVTSTGMTPEIPRDKSKLPKNNRPVEDDEFGFWQPDEIPVGKASLAHIMRFLADHQGDPKLWTSSAIANEYKLDQKNVENILEYYKTFNLFVPKMEKPKKGVFSLDDLKINNLLGTGTPPEPPEKTDKPK